MRITVSVLIMSALLAASAALADGDSNQPEYHAKLKDQVLYVMLSQPQTYVLPHLYVFDANGTAIYAQGGI